MPGEDGYPWAHYTAEPDRVADSGDAILAQSQDIHDLRRGVIGVQDVAVAAVDGDILPAVANATDPVARRCDQVAAETLVAGGGVTLWSHHITDHNSAVDKLNRAYEAEAGTSADGGDSAAPKLVDGPGQVALRETEADYQHLYDLLAGDLDADAASVAKVFHEGPTEPVVRELLLAGALPPLALSLYPGMRLGPGDYQTLLGSLREYGELEQFLRPACGSSEELKRQLDAARFMGLPPREYADLLETYYVTKAAEKAGIDLRAWNPERGVDDQRDIIEDAFACYGQLFLDNPYMRAAGFINMMSPALAAGMFDVDALGDLSGEISAFLGQVPGELPGVLGELEALGSRLTAQELRFFEETLLKMQKEIFVDQMSMHEAYLEGGLTAIKELSDAGLLDDGDADQTVRAWAQIDQGRRTGSEDLIVAGNEYLMYREQHGIGNDGYQSMKNHPGTGPGFTYLMGATLNPLIPDTQTLQDLNPLTVEATIVDTDPLHVGDLVGADAPTVDVDVETPLPADNIADFAPRWNALEADWLPAFNELLSEHPEEAREVIGSDIHDRIEDNRLRARWDEILYNLTDWDYRLGVHL